MLKRDFDREFDSAWAHAEAGHTVGLTKARALRQEIDDAYEQNLLSKVDWVAYQYGLSSLLINFGKRKRQLATLREGKDCAAQALVESPDTALLGELTYNHANADAGILDLDRKTERDLPDRSRPRTRFELRFKDVLRSLRTAYRDAGESRTTTPDIRASALCNLANYLDDSGRWVEAYEAYVEAFTIDPTNGNAWGNAAELLRRRIIIGRGMIGHYAALHDEYLANAKSLRHRTIEIAGIAVADRYDAMPFYNDHGHVRHGGDELDPYQSWIVKHRLALTTAVEGLGSDSPRWDDAAPGGVYVGPGEPDPPRIFISLNVLKADFLTARRLAYTGERQLRAYADRQHPDDTGVYASTLDSAIYGEPSAMLVLAQRSTLDLLDKLAVAANDHFGAGRSPNTVNFRGFWCDYGQNKINKALHHSDSATAALALSELAYDIDDGGLYPLAKTLRNAGTHRIIRVNDGSPVDVTDATHSTVTAEVLIASTHESLMVARAAYLYLIDLIADGEMAAGHSNAIQLGLPTQE